MRSVRRLPSAPPPFEVPEVAKKHDAGHAPDPEAPTEEHQGRIERHSVRDTELPCLTNEDKDAHRGFESCEQRNQEVDVRNQDRSPGVFYEGPVTAIGERIVGVAESSHESDVNETSE